MTEDLKTNNPEIKESTEPSPGQPIPPSAPNIQMPKIHEIKDSHYMLTSFREAVKEGTYQGKSLVPIAQGLIFLDNLIGQSQAMLERARAEEQEAIAIAKSKIRQNGGQVNG